MAGQNDRAANAAMAQRLKAEGQIRRTCRHPVTGKLIHSTRLITEKSGKGKAGTIADFYNQIAFGK